MFLARGGHAFLNDAWTNQHVNVVTIVAWAGVGSHPHGKAAEAISLATRAEAGYARISQPEEQGVRPSTGNRRKWWIRA